VLFDLESGVIGTAHASPLGEFIRQENLVNQNASAGNNWAKGHDTRAGHEFC
jgi:tubulin beta